MRMQKVRVLVLMAGLLVLGRQSAVDAAPLDPQGQGQEDEVPEVPTMAYLPMPAATDYLLIDDVNQDHIPDLLLTSHGGNVARVFLQREGRQWQAGPPLPQVGFHPGHLLRIPEPGPQPRYLALAEGEAKLKILAPESSGDFRVLSEIPAAYPRAGNWFTWPGWGKSLAYGSYINPSVILIKGFDTQRMEAARAVELRFEPNFERVEAFTTADIDGDGIEEVLFFNSGLNAVQFIRYPGPEGVPKIEFLWILPKGGRSHAVVAADLDQDGDIDILVPDQVRQDREGTTALNLFLNDGQGDWRPDCIKIPLPAGIQPGIRSADFGVDRDGQGYVLAAGYRHLVLVRIPSRRNGYDEPEIEAPQMEAPEIKLVPLPKPTGIPQILLEDLDGDGWLDGVFANSLGAGMGGRVIYGPLWTGFAALQLEGLAPGQSEGVSPDQPDQSTR